MNVNFRKTAAAALATLGVLAFHQPAFSASLPDGEEAVENGPVSFFPMFLIGKGADNFTVVRPGRAAEPGVSGRAYPFGTRVQIQGGDSSKVTVSIAPEQSFLLSHGADCLIGDDPDKPGCKRLELASGQLETYFSKDDEVVFPVSVVCPSAMFDDLDGRVTISAGRSATSRRSAVHVSDGKVTISAPQLMPSRIGNATGLIIDTLADGTFTTIDGLAGDYTLLLENGNAPAYEAAFHVGSRVKIWRSWARTSKLLAVAVLIANVDGAVADSYAFNEGQAPVKNGASAATGEAANDADEADATGEANAAADPLSDFGTNVGAGSSDTGSTTGGDDAFDFSSFNF